MGPSWAVLGPSWAALGLSWAVLDNLGAVLELTWNHIGLFLNLEKPPKPDLATILAFQIKVTPALGMIREASPSKLFLRG